MIYRDPKVDPQMQSGTSTEGSDCAVQTARGAIRWATNGATVPSVKEIRQVVGKAAGGLDVLDVRNACQHYGLQARISRSLDEIYAALDSGWVVVAAVNYRYLNANYPELSGDRNFTGTAAKPACHSILLFGRERVIQDTDATKRGPIWITDHDPLHDARRASVPKEPVNARQLYLENCMKAMPSGVQAVIVRPTW